MLRDLTIEEMGLVSGGHFHEESPLNIYMAGPGSEIFSIVGTSNPFGTQDNQQNGEGNGNGSGNENGTAAPSDIIGSMEETLQKWIDTQGNDPIFLEVDAANPIPTNNDGSLAEDVEAIATIFLQSQDATVSSVEYHNGIFYVSRLGMF